MAQRRKDIIFSLFAVVMASLMVEGAARGVFALYYRSLRPLLYGIRHSNVGALVSDLTGQRLNTWQKKKEIQSLLDRSDFSAVNSYGFIGREFSTRKPKGTYRIVAMGSSTTAGLKGIGGTRRYPYTGFLQELFDVEGKGRGFGKKIEVLNAGVMGMDIGGIERRLQEKVLPLDPDLIILSSVWVDLMPIAQAARQIERGIEMRASSAPPPGQHQGKALVRWYVTRLSFAAADHLARGSMVVTGMQAVARRLLQGRDSIYLNEEVRGKLSRMIAEHPLFSVYENDLRKITELLAERRICLLLLRAPYKYPARHFNPPNRLYYMYPLSRIYGIIEKVAGQYRVPVADLEGAFNRMPDKQFFFTDVMHMNAEGYQKLASAVFRVILDGGLLEKQGCRMSQAGEGRGDSSAGLRIGSR